MTNQKSDQGKDNKVGIDSDKIELDDAGRIKELNDEQLEKVAGGMRPRGDICRIQTDPKGCSMNM